MAAANDLKTFENQRKHKVKPGEPRPPAKQWLAGPSFKALLRGGLAMSLSQEALKGLIRSLRAFQTVSWEVSKTCVKQSLITLL